MDLIILGASGSIGTQAIDIIKNHKNKWTLSGFSVGKRVNFIEEYIKEFETIKYICVENKQDFLIYKNKYPHIKFFYGNKGLIKLINANKEAIVLNSLVGFVGLEPSIVTLKNDQTLLLANKESLVCGGDIIQNILKKKGELYPIDSEHVALAKCLYKEQISNVDKLIITASGGPFYYYSLEELKNVTKEMALNHPTWKMGGKITIDSATMMNKTFEIIEAHYLFNFPIDKIEAIVNRKSLVHSLVKFKDGRLKLNVGENSMKHPIWYALNLGVPDNNEFFEDVEINTQDKYEFLPLSKSRFKLLKYADLVIQNHKTSGLILNAVNEECVYAFLNNEIKFIDIEFIIDKIMSSAHFYKVNNYKLLYLLNSYYRKKALKEIKKR